IGADVDPRLTPPRARRDLDASTHGGEAPLQDLGRHGHLLSSCRLERGEGRAGRSRTSVHLLREEIDAAAGPSFGRSMSRGNGFPRCFLSPSPTLRPWIDDRWCMAGVLRGGALEPEPRT